MGRSAIDLLRARNHPLRRALIDELHIRRFPAFAAPMRMTQVVMFTGEEDPARIREHVEDLCARYNVAPPPKGRYFSVQLAQLHFVWECDTEFSTYSFIRAGAFDDPFAFAGLYEKNEVNGKTACTFTVITTEPNELMQAIHTRMPVMLHKDAEKDRINPDIAPEQAMEILSQDIPADTVEAYQISNKVNRPTYDNADL